MALPGMTDLKIGDRVQARTGVGKIVMAFVEENPVVIKGKLFFKLTGVKKRISFINVRRYSIETAQTPFPGYGNNWRNA